MSKKTSSVDEWGRPHLFQCHELHPMIWMIHLDVFFPMKSVMSSWLIACFSGIHGPFDSTVR